MIEREEAARATYRAIYSDGDDGDWNDPAWRRFNHREVADAYKIGDALIALDRPPVQVFVEALERANVSGQWQEALALIRRTLVDAPPPISTSAYGRRIVLAVIEPDDVGQFGIEVRVDGKAMLEGRFTDRSDE
jgi:hypothetical protein